MKEKVNWKNTSEYRTGLDRITISMSIETDRNLGFRRAPEIKKLDQLGFEDIKYDSLT